MTVLYVVAVRDAAVHAFNRPFFVPTIGVAVRSFADEVNRKADDNQMFRHPEDFELWSLGVFDDETGEFQAAEKRCVSRAKDVVQA